VDRGVAWQIDQFIDARTRTSVLPVPLFRQPTFFELLVFLKSPLVGWNKYWLSYDVQEGSDGLTRAYWTFSLDLSLVWCSILAFLFVCLSDQCHELQAPSHQMRLAWRNHPPSHQSISHGLAPAELYEGFQGADWTSLFSKLLSKHFVRHKMNEPF
jgi:hypothetical protein